MKDPLIEPDELRDRWAGSVLGVHVSNNKARFDPLGDGGPRWAANATGAAWRRCLKTWTEKRTAASRPYDPDHD